PVGPNGLADNRRIGAKPVLTDVPADDDHRRAPRPNLLLGEIPAPQWCHPEQREAGRRDRAPVRTFRPPLASAQVDRALREGGQVVKALLLFPPGHVVTDRHRVAVDIVTRPGALEMNDPVGLVEGETPEDAAPGDAPHRRREADTEGEGHDRDAGEAGMLDQHPEPEPKVGEEGAQDWLLYGDGLPLRAARAEGFRAKRLKRPRLRPASGSRPWCGYRRRRGCSSSGRSGRGRRFPGAVPASLPDAAASPRPSPRSGHPGWRAPGHRPSGAPMASPEPRRRAPPAVPRWDSAPRRPRSPQARFLPDGSSPADWYRRPGAARARTPRR